MPENQPIRWELLDEARGEIAVPPGTKLKLKISADGEHMAALEELAPDDLQALDLGHTAVTDRSLIYIQHLTGLYSLELTSTSIGDHGLSFIQHLHNLHSLGLSYSRVTNGGLVYLSPLNQLREIWLSGTQIDDLGLESLYGLIQLVQLGLSNTHITDAGLFNLAKLKQLLRVYLFNTRITPNGAQLLKKLLPQCKVKWHPPKVHTLDTENLISKGIEYHQYQEKNVSPKTSHFAEEDFWQLIDLLDWQQEGNDTAVTTPLIESLAKFDTEDILQFAEILSDKLYMLDGADYASQIGSDAYQGSKGSFAKNWFLYVRCCVVANGRDYYFSVLDNPRLMPKDTEFRGLLNVVPQAYKMKTGQRFIQSTKHNYETFSNQKLWVGK